MAIEKRGDTYRVKNRGVNGKYDSRSFATLAEARLYDAQAKQKKGTGTLMGGVNRITVSELFESWIQSARSRAADSWRRGQRTLFQRHVAPVIGDVPAFKLKPGHVEEVLNQIHDKGFGKATQYHAYSLIHVMYRALSERTGTLNPATSDLRPRVPVNEARHLTPDQLRKLIAHVIGKPYDVAIWVSAFLGLRACEVQGLRRDDLDLDGGWLTVRRSFNNKDCVFREYPKGRRQRTLPIPGELLLFLRERVGHLGAEEFVTAPPRWARLDYWAYMDALKAYGKAVGITAISAHTLRHSVGTLFLENGAGRGDIQQLLGHESASTTERYLHGRGTGVDRIARTLKLFPNVPKKEDQETKIS